MRKEGETITDVQVIEQTEFQIILPEIPDALFVKDKSGELKEHSLEVVAKLDKEADELIKSIKGFDDKAGYALLEAKKQEAVKQRTLLESKRKEVTRPINEFAASLKAKTDTIGNAAIKVQEKIEAKLDEKLMYEEEQERIRLEAIAKKKLERIEEIVRLGGISNPLNGTYSFPYTDGAIFSNAQLEEFTEEEWHEEVISLYAAQEEEEARLEAEKEKEEAEAAAQKAKDDALIEKQIKLRKKELDLNGWAFCDDAFYKNGKPITPEDVATFSDEEWDARIGLGNEMVTPQDLMNDPDLNLEPEESINEGGIIAANIEYGQGLLTPDPLEEVIGLHVSAHEEHQAKVDGIVNVTFQFSKDNPYVDQFLTGKTIQRLFPEEYEPVATKDINPDWVMKGGVGQYEGLNLYFLLYKRPE